MGGLVAKLQLQATRSDDYGASAWLEWKGLEINGREVGGMCQFTSDAQTERELARDALHVLERLVTKTPEP